MSMLGQRAHSFTCPCDDENDVMRVSASIRWSSSCRKSPGHDGASPLAVRRVYIQPYSRDNRAPGAPRCPCRCAVDSCASVRFQGAVQKPWVSGEISCCGQCVAAQLQLYAERALPWSRPLRDSTCGSFRSAFGTRRPTSLVSPVR